MEVKNVAGDESKPETRWRPQEKTLYLSNYSENLPRMKWRKNDGGAKTDGTWIPHCLFCFLFLSITEK